MKSSLRARIIAEWRGLPGKTVTHNRWTAPADILPNLMQRLGLRERLHETEVAEAWSKHGGLLGEAGRIDEWLTLIAPTNLGK